MRDMKTADKTEETAVKRSNDKERENTKCLSCAPSPALLRVSPLSGTVFITSQKMPQIIPPDRSCHMLKGKMLTELAVVGNLMLKKIQKKIKNRANTQNSLR